MKRGSLRESLIVCAGLLGACAHNTGVSPAPVAQAWLTTADQSRLLSRQPDVVVRWGAAASPVVIDVDEGTSYQEMIGFGAAMTDASAYLIQHKLGAQRDAILHELFGREPGLGLSFVRVPMGASDFSMHDYSYDDMPAGQTDPAL